MRMATLAFFWFPFSWNIYFHPLTFSLYVSLGLKWVSCRQHIYGSCFCIHSASVCLLVGAYNPFTFKVIIDMYVAITIFLKIWNASQICVSSLRRGHANLLCVVPILVCVLPKRAPKLLLDFDFVCHFKLVAYIHFNTIVFKYPLKQLQKPHYWAWSLIAQVCR